MPWLVLAAVLATTSYVNLASAADVTGALDVMSSQTVSEGSNHSIVFVTPTGVDASTDTITVTFPAGFDLATNTVAFGDIDLAVGDSNNCSTATFTDKTLAAAPSTTPTWGAVISGQVLTFTAPTDAASGEITADRCVQIQIGTNATGGANQIINPGTAASAYNIAIAGVFGDSGSLNVPIIDSGTVTVTATVDPTISFSITSTCNLPNMNASTISACALSSVVATNAVTGYSASVVGANSGTLVRTGGSGTIAALSGTLDAAVSGDVGFGITTNDSGGTVNVAAEANTCSNITPTGTQAITSVATSKVYANGSGVTDGTGEGAVTVCVRAKPEAVTPAGAYTTTLTFTAVGNF